MSKILEYIVWSVLLYFILVGSVYLLYHTVPVSLSIIIIFLFIFLLVLCIAQKTKINTQNIVFSFAVIVFVIIFSKINFSDVNSSDVNSSGVNSLLTSSDMNAISVVYEMLNSIVVLIGIIFLINVTERYDLDKGKEDYIILKQYLLILSKIDFYEKNKENWDMNCIQQYIDHYNVLSIASNLTIDFIADDIKESMFLYSKNYREHIIMKNIDTYHNKMGNPKYEIDLTECSWKVLRP